jgi:hypothetical protein
MYDAKARRCSSFAMVVWRKCARVQSKLGRGRLVRRHVGWEEGGSELRKGKDPEVSRKLERLGKLDKKAIDNEGLGDVHGLEVKDECPCGSRCHRFISTTTHLNFYTGPATCLYSSPSSLGRYSPHIRVTTSRGIEWSSISFYSFENAMSTTCAIPAYFYRCSKTLFGKASRQIYSTRRVLGPFLFDALFFLWPLSNATALWWSRPKLSRSLTL